jgi:excisionase family DNA binding protein
VPKALLDVDGRAARLGVTVRFVRRLVEERRVPYLKIGRLVRFDSGDVERWIVATRIEPFRAPGTTGRGGGADVPATRARRGRGLPWLTSRDGSRGRVTSGVMSGYRDDARHQRKRSFERKLDAQRFARAVESDLLRGD